MFIVISRIFRCSLEPTKRAYYRLLNAIYNGKVGRFTSEEVVLQLVSSKCLPILLRRIETVKTVALNETGETNETIEK